MLAVARTTGGLRFRRADTARAPLASQSISSHALYASLPNLSERACLSKSASTSGASCGSHSRPVLLQRRQQQSQPQQQQGFLRRSVIAAAGDGSNRRNSGWNPLSWLSRLSGDLKSSGGPLRILSNLVFLWLLMRIWPIGGGRAGIGQQEDSVVVQVPFSEFVRRARVNEVHSVSTLCPLRLCARSAPSFKPCVAVLRAYVCPRFAWHYVEPHACGGLLAPIDLAPHVPSVASRSHLRA